MTSDAKRQRHKDGHRSRIEAARIADARAQRRSRITVLGIVAVFVALIVGAAVVFLGDDDEESTDDAAASTTSDPAATESSDPEDTTEPGGPAVSLPTPPEGRTIEGETPCPAEDGSEERVAAFAQAPPTCIDEGETLEAEIVTSAGPVTIALDTEAAPVMANNFVVLARYRYFDGLPFHRLVPDFVAQTGSSGTPDYGSGGPGYDQEDIEKPADGYAPGDVAMARAETVSGSQFFIVASDAGAAQLTPEYPRFARVTEGLELVTELAATGDAATNGTPTEVITVDSVTIRAAEG